MKRNKLNPVVIAVVGVFLGRGAQADTVITFEAGGANNAAITSPFGSAAGSSSPGVLVTGSGSPNINLTWGGTGGATQWEFYNDSVWSAGQLNGSTVGSFHNILFTPSLSAVVQINSFNFHPYYASTEVFDYGWSVRNGASVLASGSTSFNADATKNHPVNVNYTGLPGQTLELRIDRVGGTGIGQNIAVDDVRFSQVPEPGSLTLLTLGGLGAWGWSRRRRKN